MTLTRHKIYKYVIIASLNSESGCKLINRIPGSRLLISSLPSSALRTHVETLCKPRDVNKRSQRLISKDTILILSIEVMRDTCNGPYSKCVHRKAETDKFTDVYRPVQTPT